MVDGEGKVIGVGGRGRNVMLRRAGAAEVVDLRHAILRDGLPRSAAIFAGDELPTTRHFVAAERGRIICCLSLILSPWQDEPAWQLRGMATAAAWQGRGVGGRLIVYATACVRTEHPDVRWMWCNARASAVKFYEKLGWRISSELFEIPTAGPHVKMSCYIGR
jgi:predicted GNAT family N-acyltransferase